MDATDSNHFEFDSSRQEHSNPYWRFVNGKVRVLVATFALGSRGLDYADTMKIDKREAPRPLSLAVILFDFPHNIGSYVHCIGRTARPGQRAGRVLAFLPEMRFWIAKELVELLDAIGVKVPEELRTLISDDRRFLAECREAMTLLSEGKDPPSDNNSFCGGDFDRHAGLWILPAHVPSYRRKLLHWLSDEVGLPHVSNGEGTERNCILLDSDPACPISFL